MARKAQPLKLSDDELRSLKILLRRGSTPARTQARAGVLDLLHRGQHLNRIAETLQISGATVFNIKRRYLEEGLDKVLMRRFSINRDLVNRPPLTAPNPPRSPHWLARMLRLVMPAGACACWLTAPSNSALLIASRIRQSERF
jgi:Homeodomain-like domain